MPLNNQALSEWLTRLESRHVHSPIKLGLERVEALADLLGCTRFDVPVIHVGGTNGKGSTIRALEAIYHKAGYTVAAYTSPHLRSFNERIRINQTDIPSQALCQAFEAVEALPGASALTYFEFTTLAALWYFKQLRPDVILLEVGLGGRLDATNVVEADLAVITTVDLDHQAYLGQTKAEIAYEKAGIFKSGKQAIYADSEPPASIEQTAQAKGVRLFKYQEDFAYQMKETYRFTSAQFSFESKTLPTLHPQAMSAAIMATVLLKTLLPLPMSAYDSLSEARLPGRLQWVKEAGVDWLLDVAHNPQSVRRLSTVLSETATRRRIHALFSAFEDKAIDEMIAEVAPYIDIWHVAAMDEQRGASQAQLEACFEKRTACTVLWYNSLVLAYDEVKARAKPGELVVVFGSFITVATILNAGVAV